MLAAGCEEDVVMVEGTERPFTMYGVLNPRSDTQFVHVFPVEQTLTPTPEARLDVQFTSTDVVDGTQRVWSDSLVQDSLGLSYHVFWIPERVAHEHTYRLQIERTNGEKSEVEVTVPPSVSPRLEPPITGSNVRLPVLLLGEAPQILKPEIYIWAAAIIGYTPTGSPIYQDQQILLSGEVPLSRIEGGWRLSVNLKEGFTAAYQYFNQTISETVLRRNGIELWLISLELIVANEEWDPPGGVFDPLIMVHPEIMNNVRNGFGFVGGGYRIRHQWKPAPEVAGAAGFNAPG